jgi:hypothetical protein
MVSNDIMINGFERTCKEEVMAYFKVLSLHPTRGTEENHDGDSNGAPAKCTHTYLLIYGAEPFLRSCQ